MIPEMVLLTNNSKKNSEKVKFLQDFCITWYLCSEKSTKSWKNYLVFQENAAKITLTEIPLAHLYFQILI